MTIKKTIGLLVGLFVVFVAGNLATDKISPVETTVAVEQPVIEPVEEPTMKAQASATAEYIVKARYKYEDYFHYEISAGDTVSFLPVDMDTFVAHRISFVIDQPCSVWMMNRGETKADVEGQYWPSFISYDKDRKKVSWVTFEALSANVSLQGTFEGWNKQ